MRGWYIDPESRSVEAVEIHSDEDIAKLIGYDTVAADAIDDHDSLHFDEECFLRRSAGRFQLDTLVPVSGKAVIIGRDEQGKIADVTLDEQGIAARLAYLE